MTPQLCNLPIRQLDAVESSSASAWIIGDNQDGLAWIQGDEVANTAGNIGAENGLNSRSFWIQLNSEGYPTGRGSHNGPLLQGEQSSSGGDGDLRWA